MKKLIAAILSAAMLITISGCSNGSDASGASGASDASGSETSEDKVTIANPVKKTEDGDIDMEVALKYETDFDALKASLAEREVDNSLPVSLNARNNPKTMKIWNILKENYGKKMISAQQQMNLTTTNEDKVYYNAVEDLPAMKGFDFIFANGDNPDRGFVDAAIEWGKTSGGLVTFCWHWNVPRDVDNPSLGRAFYMDRDGVKIENWNVRNATTPGTKEYEVVVHDIDLIASYLQELEAEGITVLWRPYHEASGSWFWWGLQPSDLQLLREGKTPDNYQRLWYLMFDRLENYHKLSNIIWVWNGQSKYCMVDPNTYDIAGIDFYASKVDHSPCTKKFNELNGYTEDGKMLALTETGYVPDPQQCVDEGVMWLYYMTWNGGFIYNTGSDDNANGTAITDFYGTPEPNPKRLSNDLIKEYFTNDAMITWNDLAEMDMPYGEHKIPQPIVNWNYFKEQE